MLESVDTTHRIGLAAAPGHGQGSIASISPSDMQAMLCITHKRLLAPSYSLVKGPTGAFTRIYYDTIYMKIPLNKLSPLDIALGGLCTMGC